MQMSKLKIQKDCYFYSRIDKVETRIRHIKLCDSIRHYHGLIESKSDHIYLKASKNVRFCPSYQIVINSRMEDKKLNFLIKTALLYGKTVKNLIISASSLEFDIIRRSKIFVNTKKLKACANDDSIQSQNKVSKFIYHLDRLVDLNCNNLNSKFLKKLERMRDLHVIQIKMGSESFLTQSNQIETFYKRYKRKLSIFLTLEMNHKTRMLQYEPPSFYYSVISIGIEASWRVNRTIINPEYFKNIQVLNYSDFNKKNLNFHDLSGFTRLNVLKLTVEEENNVFNMKLPSTIKIFQISVISISGKTKIFDSNLLESLNVLKLLFQLEISFQFSEKISNESIMDYYTKLLLNSEFKLVALHLDSNFYESPSDLIDITSFLVALNSQTKLKSLELADVFAGCTADEVYLDNLKSLKAISLVNSYNILENFVEFDNIKSLSLEYTKVVDLDLEYFWDLIELIELAGKATHLSLSYQISKAVKLEEYQFEKFLYFLKTLATPYIRFHFSNFKISSESCQTLISGMPYELGLRSFNLTLGSCMISRKPNKAFEILYDLDAHI